MKRITIELTDEEYEGLKLFAEYKSDIIYKVKPKNILVQFVADLTASDRSGGSDERDFAESWFNRSSF